MCVCVCVCVCVCFWVAGYLVRLFSEVGRLVVCVCALLRDGKALFRRSLAQAEASVSTLHLVFGAVLCVNWSSFEFESVV